MQDNAKVVVANEVKIDIKACPLSIVGYEIYSYGELIGHVKQVVAEGTEDAA